MIPPRFVLPQLRQLPVTQDYSLQELNNVVRAYFLELNVWKDESFEARFGLQEHIVEEELDFSFVPLRNHLRNFLRNDFTLILVFWKCLLCASSGCHVFVSF